MDEQIFAVQEYGGISRMFAQLAEQFISQQELEVALEALNAPVINHYILNDPLLRQWLAVRPARSHIEALAYYFLHRRRRGPVDVVHGSFYLPRGLVDHPGVPKVMTVHDMIPELLPQTRRRLDFLTLKRRYVEKVDHIICVSEWTKADLIRIFGPIDTPITVVHHGVDTIFRPGSAPLPGFPDRYLLHVGNRSSYKDGETLLRAFAHIHQDVPDLRLVLVGGGSPGKAERSLLGELGIELKVTQTSLAEADMPSAYANAVACIFPSRYEGFGLPALEAMASGTPLILSRSSSLPEIGGDAARYFTPGDAIDLANQVMNLMDDRSLTDLLVDRGLSRAATFTWRRAAEETVAVYERAINDYHR